DLMKLLNLFHQAFSNMQPTRSIHNDHMYELTLVVIYRCLRNGSRLLGRCAGAALHLHCCWQSRRLLYSSRAINIGAYNHHLFLFTLSEKTRKLGHGRGLTRPLQTSHENNSRWFNRQIQAFVGLTHDGCEFKLHNFEKLLTWVERARHLVTE